MKQTELFDTSPYVTWEGLLLCRANLTRGMKDALASGNKELFQSSYAKLDNLNSLSKKLGFLTLEMGEGWDSQREKWAERANSLISKIYKKMARIDVKRVGLGEANRQRVHLQKKLNRIGRVAARRKQLRIDDGYVWLESGNGLKPYLPL